VNYPYPEVSGLVRAKLHIGGYILQKFDLNTTAITYIFDSDIKGSIPDMIKNILSCEHAIIPSKIGPAMLK
jgi:hypothetical protein